MWETSTHLGNWEKLARDRWVYLAYLVALEILGRSPVSSTSWCHLAVLGSYLALSSSDLEPSGTTSNYTLPYQEIA